MADYLESIDSRSLTRPSEWCDLNHYQLNCYSAMAGAVGGGGLGELAIQYGYQRFNVTVMLETVAILVLLVIWVQAMGDHIAKRRKLLGVAIFSVLLWLACIVSIVIAALPQRQTLTVGIMSGEQQKIMAVAKNVALKDYGLHLKLVALTVMCTQHRPEFWQH